MKNKSIYILTLAAIAASYSVLEVLLVKKGIYSSSGTATLWTIVFAILVAFWTQADAKERKIEPPYEYSFFVFLFWPVVLPYHLFKTRGIEGLVQFFGFVALAFLPSISGLYTYVYFAKAS